MNRVLMIAYHFPPVRGSSGVHRTLQFVRHLPRHGWQPVVLAPHPRAYERTGSDLVGDVPAGVPVRRGFALDAARHLAVKGRYLRCTALPDRWASWALGAVPLGFFMIRRYRPGVLWSTYPVATAHLIGYVLARLTGIPWVADFRDPLGQEGYPADPRTRRAYWALERRVVRRARACVFTTPGTARVYRERYPTEPESKWWVIENGFDETSFREAERLVGGDDREGPVRLVHSGLLYPGERNPLPFFAALGRLVREGRLSRDGLRVVLRGSGHEDRYGRAIREHGVEHIVSLAPSVPYREALAEMMSAGGLLLFQGPTCNDQIPAKAYEYIRAGRPVLALTDPAGDTARLLGRAGAPAVVVPMLDEEAVAAGVLRFLDLVRENPAPADAREFSRTARTADLARVLAHVQETART